MSREQGKHTTKLEWRKSSYSGPEGGDCVEVAGAQGPMHVRDSKDRQGPVVTLAAASWKAFLPHVDLGPAC